VALDGLVFFRRSFLALAFFHSQVIRKRQDSSSDSVGCRFLLDFVFEALQVNFFGQRRHSGFLCRQIDALDGGVDDRFDVARKAAGASIRTPLSEKNG
jgi:hypothetical protein